MRACFPELGKQSFAKKWEGIRKIPSHQAVYEIRHYAPRPGRMVQASLRNMKGSFSAALQTAATTTQETMASGIPAA